MRLSSVFILAGAFTVAAVTSLVAAGFAVSLIERSSETGVRTELDQDGLGWAEVEADGLQVILTGTAPSEAIRFQARTMAGRVVDAARVIDRMGVAAAEDIAPPRFSIEMLRNDEELSLTGLIPLVTNREALIDRFSGLPGVEEVSDLLQTADYDRPEGWRRALDFSVLALRDVPRSKISMDAGTVSIVAMTDSMAAKGRLEARLKKSAPDSLTLTLDISAPRPVVTPFTLRYLIEDGTGRFDACSADTAEARETIVAAARDTHLEGAADCVLGLGVPTPDWAAAADMAIRGLGRIGDGSVTFSDADISLVAVEGADRGTFDQVVGELENNLPDVFALHAVLPETPDAEEQGPPEFAATLSPEGLVQLRGRVSDEVLRAATISYARAKFGSDTVHAAARLDTDLPDDWPVRVLAGLESLSWLSNGAVTVTPDAVSVRGETGRELAGSEIARLLSAKLGEKEDFAIDVVYREKLDPLAAIPTPEECLAQLTEIQTGRKIYFEPGKATITADSRGVMDDIADVLKTCGEIPLEISGHTDSQGREEMNQQLSQARAQTVLNELRMRRVLTAAYTARGYGEETPIADNGTEEGREANRRIEFSLIGAETTAVEGAEADADGAATDDDVETELASPAQSVAEGDAADPSGEAASSGDATDEQN
ncbi:OmpA family protein [Pseudooceanicola aestuarii]|uniref:OmpA family protein n=1 Tax=Pseudooceanicola aestuarii TaxID=2697319 RepID=UPI0013D83055